MTIEQKNILENAILSGVLSSEEVAAARLRIKEYDDSQSPNTPGTWSVSDKDSSGKSYNVVLVNRTIVMTLGGLKNYLRTCRANAEKTVKMDSIAGQNVAILEQIINEITKA